MKNFLVYNQKGKILRTGSCAENDFYLQAEDGEFVMEGVADDLTQKIINVGVDGKIVNKTPEEIELDNPAPPKIPESQRPAYITNEQWQSVLDRLNAIEGNK